MKKLLFFLILLVSTGLLMAETIFTEGFETGNLDNSPILGWTQVSVTGADVWAANTTQTLDNRTPRTGSWNACLKYANQDWIFKQVTLTAGTEYSFSFYARQDVTSGCTVKAMYGTVATVVGMTNPIITQTNVTNGNYQLFSGNFTPSTSGTYYMGINATLSYAPNYISIDDISLVSIPPAPPAIANNVSPANSSTNILLTPTLNWTAGIGSTPTGYKMYFGTTNPPTTMTDLGLVTTWTPSPALTYNQTYYWQVVPYNTNGDASNCPIWSFTTMPDPTMPIPYLQDFNASTSLPANWTSDMGIESNHGTLSSNGIRKNIYGSSPTGYFITNPIGALATVSELKFDYRIVNYSSYPSTGTAITSDKIEVQISTNNGTSFTTIHTINSTNHVTSSSFASKTVDLSAYAGQIVKIKLLATYSAGDYYVDFDNIQVRETPSNPIYYVTPTSKNFGDIEMNTQSASQTFTITNNGGGTLAIPSQPIIEGGSMNQFILTDSNTYPLSLTANQSATLQVKFAPTAEGAKSAVLNIAYNDGTLQTSSLSLTGNALNPVITTFPHTQDFTTFMPLFWSNKEGLLATPSTLTGTTSSWSEDGFANVGSTGAAILNIYGDDCNSWLISPEINLGSVSGGFKLEFDMALTEWNDTVTPTTTNIDDKFAVVISTDNGTTWTSANTLRLWDNAGSSNVYNNISNTLDHVTINLIGYTGSVKIGFYGESTISGNGDNDLFIDNFKISYDATLPVELSSFTTALTANNTVSLNWTTQSENNLRGYLIHRSSSNQIASTICISNIIQATNTSTETNYSYTDTETSPATTYYYWLQSVENDGSSNYYGHYSVRTNENVTTPVLPSITSLNSAYPNPFNSTTQTNIKADVKDGEVATLSIYNIKGQVVKTYKNLIPGTHSLTWNGKDNNNTRCSAGVYFYKLSSPTYSSVKKIMYLK